MIEAGGSIIAELHAWKTLGSIARALLVAEQELCAGILQDEMNAVAGKLEIHRYRNETGAHDAEIGSEIFRPIDGKDGDAVPARQAAPRQRACDPVCDGIEPCIGELAR